MLNKYNLFIDIMAKKSTHCGFWHGNPHWESCEKLFKYFGVKNDFELGMKLGDTFMWVLNGWGEYKHPDGLSPLDLYKNRDIPHLSELTDDDIDLVDKLNWPNAEYYDFSRFEEAKSLSKEYATPIFSGAWATFYHNVANMFGMEKYFVKMHTDPNLVIAVTEKNRGFLFERKQKTVRQIRDLYERVLFRQRLRHPA